MDIKSIEARMWIKYMQLSWYGSAFDIDKFYLWRDSI